MVTMEIQHLTKVKDIATSNRRGRSSCRDGNSGFFILLRWLIGFFLPQHIGGFFFPVNLQVSPMYGRDAHNQCNRNQPIDFDYYKIAPSDYD